VASRTELTVLAMQQGWISMPGIPDTVVNDASAMAVTKVTETATSELPSQPVVPPWPSGRWVALAAGLILAFVVLLLPRQPVGQAAAPAMSGLVDQPRALTVATAPTSEDGWQELAPLPVRRARIGMAAYRNRIYVVGGMTENGLTGRLDIYAIENGEWYSGTARPAVLANIGVAALETGLLVPGGCDAGGKPSAVVHLYAPETDTWTEVAPLPQPLCAYALTVYGGRAYLFGGWNGKTYQAVTYVYDAVTNTWSEAPPPAEARGFGAAATLADRIFYVGGYDDRREWTTCEVYLPKEERWDRCAPLLLPRGGLGLAAIGGRLYALGGGWSNYLGFNECYDPASDTWTVIKTPIVGEWRNLGLTAYETSLYAIGGWSGDYLNRVYAIEVLPWRVFIPTTFFSP